MADWQEHKLGEVTVFTNGGAWSQDEYVDSGVPVVRVSDIHNGTIDLQGCKYLSEGALQKYRKHLLFSGDLIICTVGSHPTQPGSVVGRAGIVPPTVHGALLNQNAVRITPLNATVDKRWLDYLGQSHYFRNYIIQNARGSANQVRMSISLLKQMRIRIPPPITQRRIASILSAYDDLIENNTRRIKILEEMARLIYREWFVHFRFPGHEKVKMVQSELGPVPEGWTPTSVAEICTIYRGRSYKGTELVEEGGLPFINLKCVARDGGFRTEGVKGYSGPFKPEQTVKAGDVVMAVTDMTQERRIIARAARVPRIGHGPAVFSMDLVKILPNRNVPSEYLYGVLSFTSFPDEVKEHASGANVLHLHPDRIGDFLFAPAPEALQEKYATHAKAINEECDVLHQKIAILRATRDLLLPKLISGEVDVCDVPIETEESVA